MLAKSGYHRHAVPVIPTFGIFLVQGCRMTINFGTDGWRAVIADTFTFDNLRLVTQGVADAVSSADWGTLGAPKPGGTRPLHPASAGAPSGERLFDPKLMVV